MPFAKDASRETVRRRDKAGDVDECRGRHLALAFDGTSEDIRVSEVCADSTLANYWTF